MTLVRLLPLDFVSMMAVECRGVLMGHGRVFLSVDLARSQLFWVNLWDSVLLTKVSHQKRDSRAEPWTTRNLTKNTGLGARQAQYAF